MPLVSEFTHALGLVPLLWLAGLAFQRDRRDAAWWWLALAFAVSFLADTLAHGLNAEVVGNVYPVLQSAMIGLILLDRRDAVTFAVVLGSVATVAMLAENPAGIDLFLATVAWGAVTVFAWQRPMLGLLRWCLVVTFGGGLLAWFGYAMEPGWTTWGLYQLTRVAGTALFCAAALHPSPTLRLVPKGVL